MRSATHDFDNDGKGDILWRNVSTGAVDVWLMNGAKVKQAGAIGTWPATGRLSDSATSTTKAKPTFSGVTAIRNLGDLADEWRYGYSLSFRPYRGASWKIIGASPNGHILSHNDNGAVVIRDMNEFTVTHTHYVGAVASNWTFVGTDDFDGNGSSDLLWRNNCTHAVTIWLLTNGHITESKSLAVAANSCSIDLTGDFDGDGKSDIVWTNTANGARAIWFMNGTQVSQSNNLGTVATIRNIQSMAAE